MADADSDAAAAGRSVLRRLDPSGDIVSLEALGEGFAPSMLRITLETAFGTVLADDRLSLREREIATIAILAAAGRLDHLENHLLMAANVGVEPDEIIALLEHVAVYAGWPAALSALAVARRVSVDALRDEEEERV